MDVNLSKLQEMVEDRGGWRAGDGRGQRRLACCTRDGQELATKQQYILSSKGFGKMKPIIWGLRQGRLGWGKQ